ncbi:MAG: hypothetical protein HY049_01380 [Acidobacteria bacterium]|nr:hypothetical protein [Acidobacteriota bacterium]
MSKMLKRASSVLLGVFFVCVAASVAADGARKTHEVTAIVVALDLEAKTITINGDDGQKHTALLTGAAVEAARKFKSGDRVTLTCQDNEKGEHESVIAIRPSEG